MNRIDRGIYTERLQGNQHRVTEYRSVKFEGAAYYFTVNFAERSGNFTVVNNANLLRNVFCKVKADRPFNIDAMGFDKGRIFAEHSV